MKEIEQRDSTKGVNFPQKPEKIHELHKKIVWPYDFIMMMGLSCTGKSSFLNRNNYKTKKNWDATIWGRDIIFDSLFLSGRRPNKTYGKINKFERDVLPEKIERDYHQVIIEGWNRKQRGRNRYLNFIHNHDTVSKVILVFDGPIDSILRRTKLEDRFDKSEDQLEVFIKEQHKTTEWPTWDEGWDDIFYVNSFDETGAKYLRRRLKYNKDSQ